MSSESMQTIYQVNAKDCYGDSFSTGIQKSTLKDAKQVVADAKANAPHGIRALRQAAGLAKGTLKGFEVLEIKIG